MKNIFTAVIVSILIIAVVAQGGGDDQSVDDGLTSHDATTASQEFRSCQDSCEGEVGCVKQCEKQSTRANFLFGLTVVSIVLCAVCNVFTCCPCHKFNRLRSKFNKVDPKLISEQQYKNKVSQLITTLNNTKINNNFIFQQQDISYPISKVEVKEVTEQASFLTRIQVTGQDHFGEWASQGYILCRNGDMFMWMYKKYKLASEAGQTGKWENLLYEMKVLNDEEISGKWYYEGFQNDPKYSGQWRIKIK